MGHPRKSKEPFIGDGDLLYGVKAISAFLGISPRQGLGLVERGHLTTFSVGKIICARKSTLTAWLAAQEAQAARKPDAEGSAR